MTTPQEQQPNSQSEIQVQPPVSETTPQILETIPEPAESYESISRSTEGKINEQIPGGFRSLILPFALDCLTARRTIGRRDGAIFCRPLLRGRDPRPGRRTRHTASLAEFCGQERAAPA